MKKILEVLQYGDADIRFNTDIDIMSDPRQVTLVSFQAALTMMTKLWGGNEQSIIAMIRALSIADLAVSVNRKEMLEMHGRAAKEVAEAVQYSIREAAEKCNAKVTTFGPDVKPNRKKS